jgi:hypothetical protein
METASICTLISSVVKWSRHDLVQFVQHCVHALQYHIAAPAMLHKAMTSRVVSSYTSI